jgi:hypothetical protein
MKKYYTQARTEISYKQLKKKANWIGHILHRTCLLKHVIEEKTEGDNGKRSSKE